MIVDLVTEPALEDVPFEGGTLRAYGAEGDAQPRGKRVHVVMLPPVDGWSLPYKKGDRVLAVVEAGVCYVLGQFVAHAVTVTGNTVIQPRSGGEVRVGSRSGGAWEAFMLHATAASEINLLATKLGDAMQKLGALMNAATPGTGADTIAAGLALPGQITGGKASSGAKGRATSDELEV